MVLFFAFLEINIANFNANTVKVLSNNTEVVLATNGLINEFKAIKLFQNGILTVAGQVQKGEKIEDQIALIYKGEAIIQGNKKTFAEEARKLLNTTHNEKKLLELCEEMFNVIRFVSKYERKLRTKPNEAFFWSGKTDGIGGQEIALEIALSKNGITLEGLINKNKIPMPIWNPFDDNIQALWASISKKYADLVSGEIRAVVGTNLRKDNIWETFELPALMKNPNVKKITIIDPKTKKETIIIK